MSKAAIAQAEGDLPRASALPTPLHPNADDTWAVETQVYQAILERRPAPIIPRLKEILAKPDPALGFYNGELRFWLGWTQEVAGDHAAAQESWRQARSELETFLKEQPENFQLIGDLALTNMGLGDKAAALTLTERAIVAIPIEKDAVYGPFPIEILACSIRSGMICASRNSQNSPRRNRIFQPRITRMKQMSCSSGCAIDSAAASCSSCTKVKLSPITRAARHDLAGLLRNRRAPYG